MKDKIVRLISFPNNKVKAFTMEDENGDYNIYINERLPISEQLSSYLHECGHIDNGDYDYIGDIQSIELERHIS